MSSWCVISRPTRRPPFPVPSRRALPTGCCLASSSFKANGIRSVPILETQNLTEMSFVKVEQDQATTEVIKVFFALLGTNIAGLLGDARAKTVFLKNSYLFIVETLGKPWGKEWILSHGGFLVQVNRCIPMLQSRGLCFV